MVRNAKSFEKLMYAIWIRKNSFISKVSLSATGFENQAIENGGENSGIGDIAPGSRRQIDGLRYSIGYSIK